MQRRSPIARTPDGWLVPLSKHRLLLVKRCRQLRDRHWWYRRTRRLTKPVAAIALVNSTSRDQPTGSTTNPVSYTPIAGNLVVVLIEARDSTGSASTINAPTDDAGGGSSTYVQAFNQTNWDAANQYNAACYYCASVGSGVTTITANLSAATCFSAVIILEYSGADASPLDKVTTTATSGTGTNAIAGSVTTSYNNEVVIGFFLQKDNSSFTYSDNGSYTLRQSILEVSNGVVCGATDLVVSVAGAYAGAITISSSAGYSGWTVTFKAVVPVPVSQLKVQQPLKMAIQQSVE